MEKTNTFSVNSFMPLRKPHDFPKPDSHDKTTVSKCNFWFSYLSNVSFVNRT